jgi:hypothetical protein
MSFSASCGAGISSKSRRRQAGGISAAAVGEAAAGTTAAAGAVSTAAPRLRMSGNPTSRQTPTKNAAANVAVSVNLAPIRATHGILKNAGPGAINRYCLVNTVCVSIRCCA